MGRRIIKNLDDTDKSRRLEIKSNVITVNVEERFRSVCNGHRVRRETIVVILV